MKGLEILTRILVVDDEAGIRHIIQLALSPYDVTVLEAETGVEGLSLALSQYPDVIILDFRLPDLSGDLVAERYRASGGVAPIILLSASAEVDLLVKHPAITAALSKPFRLAHLCETLETLMNRPLTRSESKESPSDRD